MQKYTKHKVFVKTGLLGQFRFKFAILDISDKNIVILDNNKKLVEKVEKYTISVINNEKILLNDFPVYLLPNKKLIEDLKKHGYEIQDENNCKKMTLNPKIFKIYLWFILIAISLLFACVLALSFYKSL